MSSSPKPCYFFVKDGVEARRSARYALSAILHQQLLQDSDLFKYFRHSADIDWNLDGIWEPFASSAKDTKIICVLDALDECEEKSREQLLEKLENYFGTGYRKARNLKIILTSRPWNSIGDELFSQSGLAKEAIHLMGENDEGRERRRRKANQC
jgi:ankyrin repeat domain-containing protein 50